MRLSLSLCSQVILGAAGGLQVAEVAGGVFFFQAHVHHVVFLVHVVAQGLAALGGGFVHLELFDGVVRQVVEHDAVVALIEILAVEQEVVELAAVDKDFAIAVEGGAGQLADEVAEHGTFGQVEGIGVVHHGVAAHHHLDLRGLHQGLAQLMRLRGLHLPHVNARGKVAFNAAREAHMNKLVGCLVSLFRNAEKIVGRCVRSQIGTGQGLYSSVHPPFVPIKTVAYKGAVRA